MFPELNNFLGVNEADLLNGKLAVITERGANASFIVHHMLSTYLKNGHKVCLVALAQSFNHFSTVSNKCGTNLSKMRDDGNLIFIEGLKNAANELTISSATTPTSSHKNQEVVKNDVNAKNIPEVNDKLVEFTATKTDHLKNLYLVIKKSVQNLFQSRCKVLVLFDDLSLLVHLGIPCQSIVHFINYTKNLMTDNESNGNGAMAALVHQDAKEEDEEIDSLCKQLNYQGSLILSVEGLPSGHCKDVHGQVCFI